MARAVRSKKDPNEPTKAQAKLIETLRRRGWGIYLSLEDGEKKYRAHPNGKTLFGSTAMGCIKKGLLIVVSCDLSGEPQQWGVP